MCETGCMMVRGFRNGAGIRRNNLDAALRLRTLRRVAVACVIKPDGKRQCMLQLRSSGFFYPPKIHGFTTVVAVREFFFSFPGSVTLCWRVAARGRKVPLSRPLRTFQIRFHQFCFVRTVASCDSPLLGVCLNESDLSSLSDKLNARIKIQKQ